MRWPDTAAAVVMTALIAFQPAVVAAASPAPPPDLPSVAAREEPPGRPDDTPSRPGPPDKRSTVLDDLRARSTTDRSLAPGTQAAPPGDRVVGTIIAAGQHDVVSDEALATLASVADRTAARAGGTDRYATAVELSASQFPEGTAEVWLATGADFPDGITASAVAGARGGPVLLTRSSTLPPGVAAELARLAPGHVWVVGGTGAISDEVVEAVRATLPSAQVVRLAGADRYGTAAALAEAFVPAAEAAFVATGLNFPDALSSGPAAAGEQAPTLLVRTTAVPASTEAQLRRLRPSVVYVVGGTGVITDSVVSRIRTITGGTVVRVAGANRFATAAAVADRFFAATTPSIVLVTGSPFADGIAAGAVAGALASPLLLTDAGAVPPRVTVDAARRVSWWLPDSGRVIRYTVIAHPDDEFAAWSVLGPRDPRRYDVLVVLTAGETTVYCDGEPVSNPWMSQQYLPQPQPTGEIYSDRCRKHRMDSWRVFVESGGFTGTAAPEELTGGPLEFEGRLIPVPLGRDAVGQVVESGSFDLAVGPDHAVVAFDMGALTTDEVLWAVQTTRGLVDRFPTQVEGDLLGAGYYNDGTTGYANTHADHRAVYDLLGAVDLGLPGSQYSTVGHAQSARAFGATVGEYCRQMCHPDAPSPFRASMGRFQYAYGWLGDGYWAPAEADQPAGFSRYQSFSKWF